jgi:hypothetical protein
VSPGAGGPPIGFTGCGIVDDSLFLILQPPPLGSCVSCSVYRSNQIVIFSIRTYLLGSVVNHAGVCFPLMILETFSILPR